MSKERYENRKAYVIYAPAKGFVKNRNGDFSADFVNARLYGQERDAQFSIKQHTSIDAETAHIIPVDIVLDPKQIFTAVLKGK